MGFCLVVFLALVAHVCVYEGRLYMIGDMHKLGISQIIQ